jgi:hypothetical protein
MKKTLLVCALLVLGLSACTSGGGGGFRLLMQDLPVDMDHVWITFAEISLYQENGDFKAYETIDANGNPLRVDLLALRNNNLGTIFNGTVDSGKYDQVRLVVTKATYVAMGDTSDIEVDLFVPSGEIKIPVLFEVTAGKLAEVTVDFDAEKSIQAHPTGYGKYILRPVVTVVKVVPPPATT